MALERYFLVSMGLSSILPDLKTSVSYGTGQMFNLSKPGGDPKSCFTQNPGVILLPDARCVLRRKVP